LFSHTANGGVVVTRWLSEHAADPDAPSAQDLSFIVMGNPDRKYGGTNAQVTPDTTQYTVLDVTREYDGVADVQSASALRPTGDTAEDDVTSLSFESSLRDATKLVEAPDPDDGSVDESPPVRGRATTATSSPRVSAAISNVARSLRGALHGASSRAHGLGDEQGKAERRVNRAGHAGGRASTSTIKPRQLLRRISAVVSGAKAHTPPSPPGQEVATTAK
jgi:hypothetical protein